MYNFNHNIIGPYNYHQVWRSQKMLHNIGLQPVIWRCNISIQNDDNYKENYFQIYSTHAQMRQQNCRLDKISLLKNSVQNNEITNAIWWISIFESLISVLLRKYLYHLAPKSWMSIFALDFVLNLASVDGDSDFSSNGPIYTLIKTIIVGSLRFSCCFNKWSFCYECLPKAKRQLVLLGSYWEGVMSV